MPVNLFSQFNQYPSLSSPQNGEAWDASTGQEYVISVMLDPTTVDVSNTYCETAGTANLRSGLPIVRAEGKWLHATTSNGTGFVGLLDKPVLMPYQGTATIKASVRISGKVKASLTPGYSSALWTIIKGSVNWTAQDWMDVEYLYPAS